MVKDGLKNEELISELLTSGSRAIDTRNEFGVHIFEGSELGDGVVSGRLSRPKYNINELQKSVNVTISELLPTVRPPAPQTVPIEVYNAATQSIEQRDDEIVRLSGVVSDLQTTVSTLQSEVQALDIEIDGVKTLQGIAQNQAQIANQRNASSISQLQFSIQKATQEAILRASLQAQNEVLYNENISLKEQLFGKTAQLQAGAKSSGTLFTVNPQPQSNPAEPPIRGSQKIGNATTFTNGETITVFNSSSDVLNMTITQEGRKWYLVSETNFQLSPGDRKAIKLIANTPTKNWTTDATTKIYTGRLIFTGVGTENTESVILATKIKRYR